ncbi:MAG: DNA polymerase III subunit alpha [Chloroflexota bacterium]|nr:DNA polymerase III subunit alpha [Chloroflexota bacterium]
MTTPAANDFVHLHVHSEFSLLDGLSRLPEMTRRAADAGMSALGLTDHGAMYGAIPFYQAATAVGIKPIIGVETYVAPRRHTDKEPRLDANPYHMILLAKDMTGYRNLMGLVTKAHLDGYYYRPRIDKELLAEHSEGLIGTSACLSGEVLRRLAEGDEKAAERAADEYRSILGEGNFFIEVQDHGVPDQGRLHPQLVELARRMRIPLLATNDTHYTVPEQHEAHDLLLCIQTGSNVDTPGRMRFDTNEFFLKSSAQMRSLFRGELPDAMDNTLRVAEMVDLRLEFDQLRLPQFPVPNGETATSWLRAECERGLAERYADRLTDAVHHRLDYELGIIDRMGYSAYFLIVADFTRFAREQGIMTTCRGSAPGSIVTYSLGITPVDPLEYGLPFERFLNPDRVTMPDIDIDFQDSRRDEVIEYVTRKYGDDKVAQIITFGTLGAKAAIRDTGRAMGLTYAEADRVAKAVPYELNISLERAIETSPQLRELIAADDRVDRLITVAKQLEGVSRHASTHAAGIVISREPLTEIMPLQRATDGRTTMTQFEMHACEALGLLKFDFLGLINLTILADAVALIEKHRGVRIDVDDLPLDDRRTFELLSTGETTGIFQLEGAGMRRYVKELRPTEVRDLAAMVALFRPGPMANIPSYIRRKHGEEAVTYLHPSLEPALHDTYGIFVYQEDIMTAAIAMADYTGPEADNLCYAIRKKKEAVLRQHEAKFKAGAQRKGIPPGIVDQVFHEFEPFARYGFNKAHATCYGLIAYQTAYLKANYPIEFMTAVLNGFRERAEKVAAVVAECRRLGIDVRPPDVQASQTLFTVETDAAGAPEAIRFGLIAVKNVGEGAIESIVAGREGRSEVSDEVGPFTSLDDLCRRLDLRTVNKRVLESLVKAGAMRSLGGAASLLNRLDTALEMGARHQRDVAAGQGTLFDLFAAPEPMADLATNGAAAPSAPEDEIPQRERLRWEKELLGLYLSEHPLGEIADQLPEYVTAYTGDLAEEDDQTRVTLGGILQGVRRVITRAGSTMLVANLEDLQGTVEVVVFPKVFAETANAWAEDAVVLISGRIDHRDEEAKLLCEAVHAWDDAVRMGPVAFSAERDRLLRGRGRGWSGNRPGPNGGDIGPGAGAWDGATSAMRVADPPRQAMPVESQAGGSGGAPAAVGAGVAPAAVGSAVPRVSPVKPRPIPSAVEDAMTPRSEAGGEPSSDALSAPVEPAELTPAPADAIPLQTSPSGTAVEVTFDPGISVERLLPAIESVTAFLRGHPGPVSVVLEVPVAGATRQVRLPQRVAWDDRLSDGVQRAAELPVTVRLRALPGES